jgi:hypothetical protein
MSAAESPAMSAFDARWAAMHAGHAAHDKANRSIMSARTNGLVAMLAPGWRVYAREDGADARMDADGEGRGGIIVEVTGTRTVDDDGELVDSRAFRCYDAYTGRTVLLSEAQVDRDRIMTFDRLETWRAIAGMCREIADAAAPRRGGRRKSLLEGEHRLLGLADDIRRLTETCTVGARL